MALGADDQKPVAAKIGQRFVPGYYLLPGCYVEGSNVDADVLDACAAAGFDVKAYLLVETIHKLFRMQRKGYATKDVEKVLEQMLRLRDIMVAEAEAAQPFDEGQRRNV